MDVYNPHAVLGLHPRDGGKIIRLYRPRAQAVFVVIRGTPVEMEKTSERGIFEKEVGGDIGPLDYKVYHDNGLLDHDPYAFSPTLKQEDLDLFAKGMHPEIHRVMGGRLTMHEGIWGAKFCVWAPNASSVALIADFNRWHETVNWMRKIEGVWELFIPGLQEGEKYKFQVRFGDNQVRDKTDPYAYRIEYRPQNAAILCQIDRFQWEDQAWMEGRQEGPMNIYEVHLGSWRSGGYRSLAHELADYCRDMGFTHVELLPITEYPLDESWGYQVSGYYAVTSRYGTPEDFQYFVNHLHKCGIGVILDWVPAHFPVDDFSLALFDGSCLYEHEEMGLHPHWDTMIFDYARFEVHNFLIGSALFFLDKMHVDGLRVDAVASLLYLNFGRQAGEWTPNKFGGTENLEAIDFVRHLNTVIQERFKGVVVMAEDSSIFGRITCPVKEGGLGFSRRWNMGWMNDATTYFPAPFEHRPKKAHLLSDAGEYCFTERFVLPLSHDEVVHEKRSLFNKMPGDFWEKCAGVRLLLSWMTCFPGDNLLFMGGEMGQETEWNLYEKLPWHLLDDPLRRGIQSCVRDLNHLYLQEEGLHSDHFEWVDKGGCTIAYRRKNLLVIHHTLNTPLEREISGTILLNTDDKKYGGEGQLRPRLATLIIRE